jgi:hypothetical protein
VGCLLGMSRVLPRAASVSTSRLLVAGAFGSDAAAVALDDGAAAREVETEDFRTDSRSLRDIGIEVGLPLWAGFFVPFN